MFTAKIITHNNEGKIIHLTNLSLYYVPRVGETIILNYSIPEDAMTMEVTKVVYHVITGTEPDQEIALAVKVLEGGQDYL
jgi:hypothetical protein